MTPLVKKSLLYLLFSPVLSAQNRTLVVLALTALYLLFLIVLTFTFIFLAKQLKLNRFFLREVRVAAENFHTAFKRPHRQSSTDVIKDIRAFTLWQKIAVLLFAIVIAALVYFFVVSR